jgi:hypothetical protein
MPIASDHLSNVPSSNRANATRAGTIPPSDTPAASALPRANAPQPIPAANACPGPCARNAAAANKATMAWTAAAPSAERRPAAMGSCTLDPVQLAGMGPITAPRSRGIIAVGLFLRQPRAAGCRVARKTMPLVDFRPARNLSRKRRSFIGSFEKRPASAATDGAASTNWRANAGGSKRVRTSAGPGTWTTYWSHIFYALLRSLPHNPRRSQWQAPRSPGANRGFAFSGTHGIADAGTALAFAAPGLRH